jgi:hypothetical protein
MEHPVYTPDLAPRDFFLFRCPEMQMINHKYPTPEESKDDVKEGLCELSESITARVLDS